MPGLEEGLFPHSRAFEDDEELEEERRLCYVGMTRARQRLVLTGAARRRIFGDYKSTTPSRFLERGPAGADRAGDRLQLVSISAASAHGGSSLRARPNPYAEAAAARRSAKTSAPFAAYEDEDQSAGAGGIVPGARVRHAQFGVGTVISVEPLDDDAKIVVRFAIGQKTLRAKYARLQPA